MVGLVQARAAGYGAIAFVDLDELPPSSVGDIAAALTMLRASSGGWVKVFFRAHACQHCPSTSTELMAALRDWRCNKSELGTTNHTWAVSKVLGIPQRMTSISVHRAQPALQPESLRRFAACLRHPISVLKYDGGLSRWAGTSCHYRMTYDF